MGVSRVGRTRITSAVVVPNVTGGYSAFSAVGSAFEVPMAVGDGGGLLGHLHVIDRATGMSGLRFHFWGRIPPDIADKSAWIIPSGQEDGYITYVDVESSKWTTAGISGGNTAVHARVLDQNIPLFNVSGNNRSVWCQVQALNSMTFGALNSAQEVILGVLQD